jgi:putative heme-binding domain-containing protein
VALRGMAQSGLKKTPDAWLPAVAGLIGSKDAEIQRQAILTTRALTLPKEANDVQKALQEVASDTGTAAAVRLAALRTLPENRLLAEGNFKVAVENLSPTAPVEVRADAVATLTRAALTPEQTLVLADQLPKIGPMEFTRLFDVFEKRTDEATGLRVVAAARDSKVLASLPDEWLGQRLKKYPDSVRKAVEALPHNVQGVAEQRAKLEELASAVKTGDIRRGQAIFNSAKTACVTCHSMGYAGGKVGPDLTSIGGVRTEIDLLESIIFPSASFVRSYEPIVVSTKSGDIHMGILRGDTEEAVTLVTGPNAEQKIARAEIADMRPGNTSIMPAGLDTQLSKQELADLVAFLKGTKWGPN